MSVESKKIAVVLCKQVVDLMNQLCLIFPEENDFVLFRESINWAMKNNPNMVAEQMIIHVYPHKDIIVANDDSFFATDKLIKSELENVDGNKNLIMDKFFRIKELWQKSLTEENKTIIWKFMNIFVVLCEKWYISKISKKNPKL